MRRAPALSFLGVVLLATTSAAEEAWPRHTIDASSRGADGVRLADVDGDGRIEIATGWEEGGLVRIYRQPQTAHIRRPWPSVTVGTVASPEDAVFVDIDGDGRLDVVSCCEGKNRTVYGHRAPSDVQRYWDESAWSTEPLTSSDHPQSWMFCLPLDVPHRQALLILGSKGNNAAISQLVPADSDEETAIPTRLRKLCDAGWIMSLRGVDMDGDGNRDVLFSDRRGPGRGVAWLKRPADPGDNDWLRHDLGGRDHEVMFLDTADLDDDGIAEVVAATSNAGPIILRRQESGETWAETMISMPADCGTGKAVAVADVDQNGRPDLIVSCENAQNRHGVFWMSATTPDVAGTWQMHPISGREEGIKFDRLETFDVDDDGDLDILTCEERENLGVIWYENPTR